MCYFKKDIWLCKNCQLLVISMVYIGIPCFQRDKDVFHFDNIFCEFMLS